MHLRTCDEVDAQSAKWDAFQTDATSDALMNHLALVQMQKLIHARGWVGHRQSFIKTSTLT
jgi:hypothetical protein